mmetsp:Transcript_45477/g.119468  ORF Transcript_45477/g.119468 Transcript_45477/m.119468 type:complete len:362 (-) Transcript_45477:346-1431(-)
MSGGMQPDVERFSRAIATARALPPNLLTQAQKLKLFALFQQASKGPPPAEPPIDATGELERAKWEAWYDVRGLSKQLAMESYSQIIENLEELVRETMPSPVPQPQWEGGTPMPQATAAHDADETVYGDEGGTGAEDDGDDEDDADADADALAMRLVAEELAPQVTATVWSTAAISVGAGTKLDVPLSFESTARCTYSFSIVNGNGPVGFRINTVPAQETPLLDLYLSSADGTLDVAGPAVLMATLDNTAAVVTSVELRCRVCLEPLQELAMLAAYEERQQLRHRLVGRMEDSVKLQEATAAQRMAAVTAAARLDELKRATLAAEVELDRCKAMQRAAEDNESACDRDVKKLKRALRQQLSE